MQFFLPMVPHNNWGMTPFALQRYVIFLTYQRKRSFFFFFPFLFQNYFVILAEKAIFLYLKAVRGIEENQGYG